MQKKMPGVDAASLSNSNFSYLVALVPHTTNVTAAAVISATTLSFTTTTIPDATAATDSTVTT